MQITFFTKIANGSSNIKITQTFVVRNGFRNFNLIKICEACAIPFLAHYFVPDIPGFFRLSE